MRRLLPALLVPLAACALHTASELDLFPCGDGGLCNASGQGVVPGGGTSGSATHGSSTTGSATTASRGATSGGSSPGTSGGSGGPTGGSSGSTAASSTTALGASSGGTTLAGSSGGTSGAATTGPSEAPSFDIDAAHDGAQPNDAVASPLQLAWFVDLGAPISYPIVGGGLVFLASGPTVFAYDLTTGQPVWNRTVATPVWLAYDRGELFGLDDNGSLTAWDGATNTFLWSTRLSQSSSSPPVAIGGLVYVDGLGSGGTTFAVSEADGGLAWQQRTASGSDGTVAAAQGVVYEAEVGPRTYAFDAATGTPVWLYNPIGDTGGGGAAPSVYEGDIFVRDSLNGNYILSAAEQSLGSFSSSLPPAFHAGNGFYFEDGVVEAVNMATSSLAWSFAPDAGLCTGAVVAGDGGQVFVGSSLGFVYELDEATGIVRSTADAGTPVTCGSETQSMAIAGGHLLVPAGNSLLVY